MLRLLSSKGQGRKDFGKPFKPCHLGIHWKAPAEFSKMSNHMPGFQSFYRFFASCCIGKLATISVRVNPHEVHVMESIKQIRRKEFVLKNYEAEKSNVKSRYLQFDLLT